MTDDGRETLGLRTLEDISELILHSHDLHETLQNIVNLVAKRMQSDVCSIYLLEKDGETLVLCATKGLSKKSVGKVRMNTSEGLTGLVVEQRGVVSIEDAAFHPRFKYFRETKEERFHSFLGLPIFEHRSPAGVIVIQTKEPRVFSSKETSTLTTIANQISSIIMNAKLLDSIRIKEEERSYFEQELQRLRNNGHVEACTTHPAKQDTGRMVRGVPVSPGFSWGKVSIVGRSTGGSIPSLEQTGSRSEEKKRFHIALEKAKIQTLFLEKRVAETLCREDAAIFHTHLMILEDRGFTAKVLDRIDQYIGAVRAVEDVVDSYVDAFSRMEDPYLRERSADMKDIGRRIVDCLTGNDRSRIRLRRKRVLVAREILPSDLAALDHDKIQALVCCSGDANSHASILAKSLGIPAVVAPWDAVKSITRRDEVIVDGNTGCIYVNPDAEIRREYERLQNDDNARRRELESLREEPAVTLDGVRIHLRANIALLNDVKVAIASGAEGVGLYRTEFPYMIRSTFPTRGELCRLYRRVLEDFAPLPVTIRTLDIGGDKTLTYFPLPVEENPFMGWRSIRLSLECPDIFREQLAGAFMASVYGTLRLMFPLITSLEEIRQVREILKETKAEVESSGHTVSPSIRVGIMIEVPAAVQIADILIDEVDFFSIGTNDLVQYTLAADRNNPKIQKYYDPFHPAVLRSIKRVADIGARAGKPVSLCGEMVADAANAVLLMGLGLTEFSLSAPAIPVIKDTLRKVSREDAESYAEQILSLGSSGEVREAFQRMKTDLNI